MATAPKYYPLPDYASVTTSIDAYIAAWSEMAEPLERELGLTLVGYDPTFQFRKGPATGPSTTVSLPVWFVRDINAKLDNPKT